MIIRHILLVGAFSRVRVKQEVILLTRITVVINHLLNGSKWDDPPSRTHPSTCWVSHYHKGWWFSQMIVRSGIPKCNVRFVERSSNDHEAGHGSG